MDLNKYLKEPAQFNPDLGWWIDAETFDVEGNHRNPHECKDELALQWGNEGYTLDTDEKIVPVKAENKMASVQADIIQLTRSMMNSGMKTATIREYLAKHQNPNVIKACSQEIERQLRLEGSVGRFVLDARGYKNCAEALKVAEKNPFKKHLKYMIGCTCGNHIKTKSFKSGMMLSGGDPIGDVMNDKSGTSVETKDSCPKTGMQILSGQGDLDESWAGNTMIDVLNACDLDEENGKKFSASKEQPYMKLKKFFIALDNGGFQRAEEDHLDMNSDNGTNMNQAPVLVKLDDINTAPVEIDPKTGPAFRLNKDAVPEKPIGEMTMDQVVSIPELEKDAEFIPVDIPVPETNTFSLNNTENRDIPVNDLQSPIEIVVAPADVLSDLEFGTPEEDELYCDGMIQLDEKQPDAGMVFSF